MKIFVILAIAGLACAQLPQGPISIQLLDAQQHRPVQVQTPTVHLIHRQPEDFPHQERPIWDWDRLPRLPEWNVQNQQPLQPIQPVPEFDFPGPRLPEWVDRQPEQPTWNIDIPRWNVQIPVQRPQPEPEQPSFPQWPVFPEPEQQPPQFPSWFPQPEQQHPNQRPHRPIQRPRPEQQPQWQTPNLPRDPVPPRAVWREGKPDARCPFPDNHEGHAVILPGDGQWSFYMCWNGWSFPFACPDDLIFRVEVNVCADPAWTPIQWMTPYATEEPTPY